MPLVVSRYVTNYMTQYVPSIVGYVTRYFTLVKEKNEDGETVVVTKIVSEVTVPLSTDKTVVVPVHTIKEHLRTVALKGRVRRSGRV